MTDACKTPMADHIAEFWRLLETEHVRVLVDIRRRHEPGSGVMYHWDGASFPDDIAKAIAADHRAAQPQSLTGCLHPGNEPKSCQYEGGCQSEACDHWNKTEYRARMTVLAQVDGILYPNYNQGE